MGAYKSLSWKDRSFVGIKLADIGEYEKVQQNPTTYHLQQKSDSILGPRTWP